MKISSKAPKTNQSTHAIADLAPKTGNDVRGGLRREASAPSVSEIVVTKDQDCSSTGL